MLDAAPSATRVWAGKPVCGIGVLACLRTETTGLATGRAPGVDVHNWLELGSAAS
jgi:hypothetical protein